uniref:hypothetical protein n=1 Tax=Streptomyces sp. NBC_01001 TaxID=2903713 RepID=UPI002F90A57A|nr:DUF11 domain-containing protein [Streptomyces sp. NBC_01001]WSW48819.1 DUF11 domain-containing protein [Streptomyces sp. NBC_01001]
MGTHGLRRRLSALGTVVGLGVALPFAVGATPAYAQAEGIFAKSHEGNFAQGGQGVYKITLTSSGSDPITTGVRVADALPSGLTLQQLNVSGPLAWECVVEDTHFTCDAFFGQLEPNESAVFTVTVGVAGDAPCTVTNTATVSGGGIGPDSSSDPTTITGGNCNGGNGNGGSILPINLNGVIPMFNNITTNNNINSPGASNNSRQNFGLNTP